METYLGTDVDIHEVGVKIAYDGLGFIFPLTFLFFFSFSIYRTARVRVDQSRCHISHNLMA